MSSLGNPLSTGDNSRQPWLDDLRSESQQHSPISPLSSFNIPLAVLEHVKSLISCDSQQIKAGLSLVREGRLEALQALQNYPTPDVLRWHAALQSFYNSHEGYTHQSQYCKLPTRPSSTQRFSNASSYSSGSDARLSFLSTSTASTQRSTVSESSPIQGRSNHILPPRTSSGSRISTSNVHNHWATPAAAANFLITANSSAPQPPPSIALPRTPRASIYFCTSCDHEPYKRKDDWAAHETEHQRKAQWPCEPCDIVLHSERQFRAHHNSSHHCKPCRHASQAIEVLQAKLRWGCGFCGKSLSDLTERNNHIASHIESGKAAKTGWNYTTMVNGLLGGLTLNAIWAALMRREGHGSDPQGWPAYSWKKFESSEVVTNLEYELHEGKLLELVRKLYQLRRPEFTVNNKDQGPKNSTHTATQISQALPSSSLKAKNHESPTSRLYQPIARMPDQEAPRVRELRNGTSGFPRPDSGVFPIVSESNLLFSRQEFAPSFHSSKLTCRAAGEPGPGIPHTDHNNTTTYLPQPPPRDEAIRTDFEYAQSRRQTANNALPDTVNPQDITSGQDGRYTRRPHVSPAGRTPSVEPHSTARYSEALRSAATDPNPILEIGATYRDFNNLMQESFYNEADTLFDTPDSDLQNAERPSSKFQSHRVSFMDVDSGLSSETSHPW